MESPTNGTKLTIKPGDPPLIEEGKSLGQHVYVIEDGRARVSMRDPLNPHDPALACRDIFAGTLLGWELFRALPGTIPYARFTVSVPKDYPKCTVRRFTKEEFFSGLRKNPEFIAYVLGSMLEENYFAFVRQREATASRTSGTMRAVVRTDDGAIEHLQLRILQLEDQLGIAMSNNGVAALYALRFALEGPGISPDEPLSSAIEKIRLMGEERALVNSLIQRSLRLLTPYIKTIPSFKNIAKGFLDAFGVTGRQSTASMPQVRPDKLLPDEDVPTKNTRVSGVGPKPSIPREDQPRLYSDDLIDTKRERHGS